MSMAKYTIDLNYYDTEEKCLRGDMCFYFQTTVDDNVWCDSAKEMQEGFEAGFKGGDIGNEIEFPELHNVCEVVDEHGMIDDPKICNIVMLRSQIIYEDEIRKAIAQRYPNAEIKVWYK